MTHKPMLMFVQVHDLAIGASHTWPLLDKQMSKYVTIYYVIYIIYILFSLIKAPALLQTSHTVNPITRDPKLFSVSISKQPKNSYMCISLWLTSSFYININYYFTLQIL